MANTIKAKKDERKLSKFMKLPIRVLAKARDFDIQSITDCSGHFDFGTVIGCPSAQIQSAFPRSFSTSSAKSSTTNNEDFRELVRAASTRSTSTYLDCKTELDLSMVRSRSVGIGRIDEDKACEFDGEEDVEVKREVYPRSRSYAVSRRTILS